MSQIQTKPQEAIEEKGVEFVPFGSGDNIKLTVSMVQSMIATKTKSGQTCSRADAMKFMALCRARRLNPFEGDAFLTGYDTTETDANGNRVTVPRFSLITAHQAFLKRAEVNSEYDGMRSGVVIFPPIPCKACEAKGILMNHVTGKPERCIICDGAGHVDEIEGDMVPMGTPSEGDEEEYKLIGGWARVEFKSRKIPMKRRVKLSTFNKGMSRWKDDPAGMIVKCAEADALRSAFPTLFGGLYLEQEVAAHEQRTSEEARFVAERPKLAPAPAKPAPVKQAAPQPEPDDAPEEDTAPPPEQLTTTTPAPAAPQPKTTVAQPELPAEDGEPVDLVRAKLQARGVAEEVFCAAVCKRYKLSPCGTLDEINEIAPARVGLVLRQFDALMAEFRL